MWAVEERVDQQLSTFLAKTQQPRILVVDNEKSIVEMIRMLLEEEYNVTTCTNSAQVIGLLQEQRPDVLLLDVMMPAPDGITLLKDLRRDPTLAKMPVILMSGGTKHYDLTPAELAQLKTRLIAKPFNNDALLHLIEELISDHFSFHQSAN